MTSEFYQVWGYVSLQAKHWGNKEETNMSYNRENNLSFNNVFGEEPQECSK